MFPIVNKTEEMYNIMNNDKRTVASKDGTCISTDGTCQKYIIKKNGRRYNRLNFDTYEQARSYVRKKLRGDQESKASARRSVDVGWLYHNNPSITDYGFHIERKAS